MSSNPSSRKGQGGRGRGRGRGGGRRGGRGRNNKRSADRPGNPSGNNNGSNFAPNQNHTISMPGMRDEDVLIAFMPYLKCDNHEAMNIHEHYQANSDQQAFLRAARDFLAREGQLPNGTAPGTPIQPAVSTPTPTRQHPPSQPFLPPSNSQIPSSHPSMTRSQDPFQINAPGSIPINGTQQPPSVLPLGHESSPTARHPNSMEAIEANFADLLSDDPVVRMPGLPSNGAPTIGAAVAASPDRGSSMFSSSLPVPPPHNQTHHQQPLPFQQYPPASNLPSQPITPPRAPGPMPNGPASSPFSSLFAPGNPSANAGQSPFFPHQQRPMQEHPNLPQPNWNQAPPPGVNQPSSAIANKPVAMPPPAKPPVPDKPPSDAAPAPAEAPKAAVKKEYQPKRLWTRLEEQPGRILANNVPANMGTVLDLRPRQELKAQWMLPLSYLRQKAQGKNNGNSMRDMLSKLTVGLFRRGCTENGTQASIVSKEILTPLGESRSDYPFQVRKDTVSGTVPFYSPRTPGHVVFRLYWQDEPLNTLATGPTLNVRVTEEDFESSIRFVLSNFKAKKVNPTSLSSLNSFALVLEQFQLPSHNPQHGIPPHLESAGRAVWGCICEARKVLDACATEYAKTTAKLQKLEDVVDDLKAKVEEESKGSEDEKDDDNAKSEEHDDEPSENALALREKQKALMSGRASCERKWRDSQLAFASILKAVVSNPSVSLIVRRDLISKLRLEYELWCPLSEEFAVPGDSDAGMWYEPLARLPSGVTGDHFRMCEEARSNMQHRSLGFDPNTSSLESVLYPSRTRNAQMNPAAVNVFNQLSATMGQLYQENYATADRIIQQREMIRAQTEKFVTVCDVFPPGTKVAIFGSSANGFGSPRSDLDMCLQIPHGAVMASEDDPTGAGKMEKLARVLEENGMKQVDTARLTARIPVIKFNCPRPLENNSEEEESFMECDLSMHNPLAVLNTALLRTYAEINPVPRVLAGVIKRWAKAREINNPARHTLSSYGYIIMLLHFLTYHQRSGNGLVSPLNRNDGKVPRSQVLPLLPNLQWMDEHWPESQGKAPYREHGSIPKRIIKHPLEDRMIVNTYFYQVNAGMLQNMQRLFPGQDLSLGILLASFFRYYAYEFDYKRHVVSLHSTLTHGVVEREVKAELDGWRNYSAALTIEDPFETFYDVAHVLRGGYYHRIRREFAVAYTKIADVASGKSSSTWNNKSVDLTNMVGMKLIDWICEPIATDREDTPK